MYHDFCDMYHKELDKFFRSKNVHPTAKKRLKRCVKPFWSDQLQTMWNDLCKRENVFISSNRFNRARERNAFKAAQHLFDREYRRAERAYHRSRLNEIDDLCTTDPKMFWKTLESLGPRKNYGIPMEVHDENGNISTDLEYVLHKWKTEYEKLFSFTHNENDFDNDFYENVTDNVNINENEAPTLDGLNDLILESEVRKSVTKAKNNKSVGIDNLPNEIFKNNESIQILTVLFNKIFEHNLVPVVWKVGIIKPIPKSSLVDPRVPLQYRGITLMSTVYKLFSNILNVRIVSAAENNNIYCDEQNGFRKGRSCADHIFVLSSIIRNRKAKGLPTYAAFIDFEKAFDRVDRNLLYYKLNNMGFNGRILDCIKNIYTDCKSGVNVNGHITDWFSSDFGVKQGDCLSPTLFGLFINDIVGELKSNSQGIKCLDFVIHCLLYADDLVLLSESEDDLQRMLDCLSNWCKKWRMRINSNKSKIIHFRVKGHRASLYNFKLGASQIEIVEQYKYLGIIMDSALDFTITAGVLADSAGRALGAVISKFKANKGLGFKTYTKLFDTGVCPIMDYCGGIWGFADFDKLNTIQNRAIRFFLGVHKFAPNLAINADMGWYMSVTRRKVEMLRYWNRLQSTNDDRLLKKVYKWDKSMCKRNWSSEMKQIFNSLNLENCFIYGNNVNVDDCRKELHNQYCERWQRDVMNIPKLRTFVEFKNTFQTEKYVTSILNRSQRSILAQFRCGILPLKIETGRFQDIPLEYRLCIMCDGDFLESESHFMLHCQKYSDLRWDMFQMAQTVFPNFMFEGDEAKLNMLMSDALVKDTAKYLHKSFQMRQSFIYN